MRAGCTRVPQSGRLTPLCSCLMAWRDQDPPATDVLLDFTVPFSGGGTHAYLEIDKLPEGLYRAIVGTLFEYQELCRTGDL